MLNSFSKAMEFASIAHRADDSFHPRLEAEGVVVEIPDSSIKLGCRWCDSALQ